MGAHLLFLLLFFLLFKKLSYNIFRGNNMKLLQEFTLQNLNQVSNIMANFNHVTHLIKFFQLRYEEDEKKDGTKNKYWIMRFILKEKALQK